MAGPLTLLNKRLVENIKKDLYSGKEAFIL